MSDLGVVHVVYAPFGSLPLEQFLASYRRCVAGIEHELILVFKDFAPGPLPDDYRALLNGLPHRGLFVADGGFDLGSYLLAAQACEHRLLCFLNSRSIILAEGWLAKLRTAHDQVGVGLAGATGTYESHSTSQRLHLPPVASWTRPRRFARHLLNGYALLRSALEFPAFPNPHVRTNAFVIERQRFLDLKVGPFRSKEDCYRFESGRRGLTRQILARGLRVLVVGQDGRSYPIERWRESETFRQGDQSNLLVADNQTRQYLESNTSERRRLASFAWGA